MTFLIVASRLTPTNAGLLAACARLGLDGALVHPREARARAGAGDTALVRLDVRESLDGVEDGLHETALLERQGARLRNAPRALLAAHDKLATALHLGHAGLPHPRTAHVADPAAGAGVGPPAVLKPRFGSWGRDVHLCSDRHELEGALREIRTRPWFARQGVIVQELVPPLGWDLRIVVAAGRVIGAIERRPRPGEWRTNVAVGASREPTDPPAGAARLACAAAAAIGADLVAIDLLPLPDGGWTVLEINGTADFTIEYSLDGRDVFERAVLALHGEALDPQAGEAEVLSAAR